MRSSYRVDGHQLTLLRNGEEYFPRLKLAIDAAIKSIYLETYIYAADASGRLITDALKQAVRRKVSVHVLLDGFGSDELPDTMVEEMRAAGIEVMWYRREKNNFSLKRYHLRRLHRKLVVVDGKLGFVGGINIIDDTPEGLQAPRLDYAVEIKGRVVRDIHASMQRLWLMISWAQFHRYGLREKIRRLFLMANDHPVQFLVRDNFRHRHAIERAYLKAINEAREEIIIANAYFLPGRKFRKALIDARQRGVKVILFLQGRVEYRLQHYATLALYREFLNAGVEIYEYRASFLHAKVAVVDAEWVTVGSSNIDPFSLWLAQEANLMVRDAQFANEAREDLLAEMKKNSHRIEISLWRNLNVFGWVLVQLSYAIARLVAGVLVYRKIGDDF